jgi:hypothetical protein
MQTAGSWTTHCLMNNGIWWNKRGN